jgi:hypothetical protein
MKTTVEMMCVFALQVCKLLERAGGEESGRVKKGKMSPNELSAFCGEIEAQI